METLAKDAKRLIRKRDVLDRIHELIHRREDEDEEENEPTTVDVDDDGKKVTLRRLETP